MHLGSGNSKTCFGIYSGPSLQQCRPCLSSSHTGHIQSPFTVEWLGVVALWPCHCNRAHLLFQSSRIMAAGVSSPLLGHEFRSSKDADRSKRHKKEQHTKRRHRERSASPPPRPGATGPTMQSPPMTSPSSQSGPGSLNAVVARMGRSPASQSARGRTGNAGSHGRHPHFSKTPERSRHKHFSD